MAVRTVKARVAVEGEKEYKAAISQLNAGNKTLAAEMKALQAEYRDNADSMEFLTAKGDLLGRMLDQQKAKTEETRKMVEQASQAYAEAARAYAEASDKDADAQKEAALAMQNADKTLQKYMADLHNAEAAEFDLNHAIEENNEALEHNGETMISLGDVVDTLGDKLGIHIPDEAKKALDGMEGFSAGTVAKMAVAAAAVAAVIKVVKELGELTLQVAAEVDEYLTESQITGVPTAMLQAWDYAAPLIDTDAETIKGAMTKLTQAMGDAKDGNEGAIEKFRELGVEFENADGTLRSAEEVFYDVVDALGQMESGSERDAAAMELMGKSAQDLNPLINAGSDALKDYAEQAEEVGYILSEDQVEALGAVDDAYQELKLTIDAIKKQMAADFAPAAQKAMELFSDAVKKAGEFLQRSGLIENLASILSSVISLLKNVGQMISSLPGLGMALDAINVTLKITAMLFATIADAADVVTGLITGNMGQVKTALGWNIGSGEMSNLQQLKYSDSSYGNYHYDEELGGWVGNAGGTDNWRGGLTWVGEAGPELAYLPQGTQILNAQDSRYAGGDTFYITIDASSVKDFNDIVELAKTAQMRRRMR